MDSKRVFGAVAVIVLKDGEVLLGQRTGTNGRGMWCFPGGKIEPGELVVEAAKRETLEEAGVAALNLDFAGYVDTPYPPSQFWLTLYFRCTEFSGEPSAPEPQDWRLGVVFERRFAFAVVRPHASRVRQRLGLEGLIANDGLRNFARCHCGCADCNRGVAGQQDFLRRRQGFVRAGGGGAFAQRSVF